MWRHLLWRVGISGKHSLEDLRARWRSPDDLRDTTEAVNLVKKFHSLQGERVETYKYFAQGHKAYLAAAPSYNFPLYRLLVHEVTESFKKISEEILGLKESLAKNHGLTAVAAVIEKIQDKEQVKLKLTAKLQIAKKNVLDKPDDFEHREEVTETEEELQGVTTEINELLEELKYETEDLLTS